MDDDDLRRGRPTCHIAYGENVAILAGDGLFAEAYRLVLERQQGEPERVLAALRELSQAISVGGHGRRPVHRRRGGRRARRRRRCATCTSSRPGRLITRERHRRAAAARERRRPSTDGAAPLRRRARRAVPDRRRHPRRDRHRRRRRASRRARDERLGKRTYVSVFGLERARELAGESHAKTRAALERA